MKNLSTPQHSGEILKLVATELQCQEQQQPICATMNEKIALLIIWGRVQKHLHRLEWSWVSPPCNVG